MNDAPPDLDHLFDTLTAFQRTAALKAAVDIDLFTAVGEGVDSVRALAGRCQASERGVRSLCDRLVVDGFLTKTEQRYGLTPTAAAFLDRRSPVYVGSATRFFMSDSIVEALSKLTEAVRRGGTALPASGTLDAEHPVWIEFARAMGPIAAVVAQILAGLLDADAAPRWRILDIAAGHGLYGITLARRNPNARVVALDWRNVLEVARENARDAGVADRIDMLPGDALSVDLGTGYDLVLLTNFLHHFSPAECTALLRRVHAALAPGGRAVAVEFVPNEDRITPPAAATFSLVMLATTPSGDAYTFKEYEDMFRQAGFANTTLHDLAPTPQRAVIATK